MRPVRAAFAAASCAVALLAPRLALACSVCMANLDERSQRAFLLTTVFLSVLPLSMFAGFGVWIWRRHQSRERALRAPASSATPAHSGARAHPAQGAELHRA